MPRMRIMRLGVLTLCLTTSCGANHHEPATPIREGLIAVERACRIGREIWVHDSINWMATDALIAAGIKLEDLGEARYLEMREADGWRVLWARDDGEGPKKVAQVRFGSPPFPAPKAERVEPPEALDQEASRRWRALDQAVRQPGRLCPAMHNTVVLPASIDGKDGYYVYLLPGTQKKNVFVLGGHVLVHVRDVEKATSEVIALSRGCTVMEPEPDRIAKLDSFMVVGTRQPVETQFFTSMRYKKRIMVGVVGAKSSMMLVVDGAQCMKGE